MSFPEYQPPAKPEPKKELNPIAVTNHLCSLIDTFANGADIHDETQIEEEEEVIDECFQLFLGRDATVSEKRKIIYNA